MFENDGTDYTANLPHIHSILSLNLLQTTTTVEFHGPHSNKTETTNTY